MLALWYLEIVSAQMATEVRGARGAGEIPILMAIWTALPFAPFVVAFSCRNLALATFIAWLSGAVLVGALALLWTFSWIHGTATGVDDPWVYFFILGAQNLVAIGTMVIVALIALALALAGAARRRSSDVLARKSSSGVSPEVLVPPSAATWYGSAAYVLLLPVATYGLLRLVHPEPAPPPPPVAEGIHLESVSASATSLPDRSGAAREIDR